MKHSYILSKNGYVMCVLGEDESCYYGEILYGRVPYSGVSVVDICGEKYYKYWTIQNRKKKLSGKVGEATKYDNYYDAVSGMYPKHVKSHPLLGKVFIIEKTQIEKVWSPKNYSAISPRYQNILQRLSDLLNIPVGEIKVAGSTMVNLGRMSKNDFDIVIGTKKSSRQMVKMIRKFTSDPKFWVEINPSHIHHRQFILNSTKICPFGSSEDEGLFEKSKYLLIQESQKVRAKVLDDSDSLLSPSRYQIMVDDKNLSFISYCVGHTVLFKTGDIIEFELPLYRFEMNGNCEDIYVCPTEGTWIDIC